MIHQPVDTTFDSYKLPHKNMPKFRSILLIDDDGITNYINSSLLKRQGCCTNIYEFKNASAALSFLKELEQQAEIFPELIFLDLHMPVLDGYEFVNIFKELAPADKTKIVILSTSLRMQDKEKLKQSGIDLFIDKPLTEDKLQTLIKHIELA